MINDDRLPLISFTGSIKVGKHVAKAKPSPDDSTRSILELGGNNGIIVTEDADLDTCNTWHFDSVQSGQPDLPICTSTRRDYRTG